MYVCLSVRLHISKTTCPNFTIFSLHVVCGRGSVSFWRHRNTLFTSGFVMTSCLHIIHLSSNGKFNLYPMPDWLAEMARKACYGKRWYLLRPGGEVCYSPLLCSLLQHPTIWNSLPSFIRLSETLVSLRKYLRTHLMLPARMRALCSAYAGI